jgi:hypothetical protein
MHRSYLGGKGDGVWGDGVMGRKILDLRLKMTTTIQNPKSKIQNPK